MKLSQIQPDDPLGVLIKALVDMEYARHGHDLPTDDTELIAAAEQIQRWAWQEQASRGLGRRR